MIYLASPYSHEDPGVREMRAKAASVLAHRLIFKGVPVFSPIAYTASMAAGTDFETWKDFDYHMISLCEEVWVLQIDGWKESIGVTNEIAYAIKHHIPVAYFNPKTGEIT